jgi:hypothetical protein
VIPNLYRKTFRLLFSGNEDFSVVGNVYFGRKAGEMTVVAYSVNAISKRQSALNEEEAPTAFGGTDRRSAPVTARSPSIPSPHRPQSQSKRRTLP